MKIAAIYARVSSDRQRDSNTIVSQTAALVNFAQDNGYRVSEDRVIEDDGFSGAVLERPGLERIRDLAADVVGETDFASIQSRQREIRGGVAYVNRRGGGAYHALLLEIDWAFALVGANDSRWARSFNLRRGSRRSPRRLRS